MFLRLSFIAAAVVAAVTCGILVRPAHATYPGDVGRLAFGMSVNGGSPGIYTVLPNGHDLRQLTTGTGFDACPGYSPNGRTIVFCSGGAARSRSGRWTRTGTTSVRSPHLDAFATFPDVSPGWTRRSRSTTAA